MKRLLAPDDLRPGVVFTVEKSDDTSSELRTGVYCLVERVDLPYIAVVDVTGRTTVLDIRDAPTLRRGSRSFFAHIAKRYREQLQRARQPKPVKKKRARQDATPRIPQGEGGVATSEQLIYHRICPHCAGTLLEQHVIQNGQPVPQLACPTCHIIYRMENPNG